MSMMTGGKFIADTVHGYGLTHVFFMPYIGPRALMEMENLGIKRVQTHGEKAAAYMADAYARVRRAPGLCMAQSVGAVNLAAGLQDAYLACSPVIAITGRELLINQQRHAYQEVNHVNPFSAVTKYSAYVAAPEYLPMYMRQAYRVATTGTPGPVHLDFEGIAGQGVVDREADLEVMIEKSFTQVPPFRPEADPESIAAALQLLAAAERPVIVAGGGVTASDARTELITLAEKLSIPVATSLNAKAMFPADHPLAVGTPGSYSRACSNQILCEADLVFFVGSHAGGQVTNGYQIPPQSTPIIQRIHHWLHRLIGRLALVAVVEDPLVWFWRQVGCMGIHVTQKEEEGISLIRQSLNLWNGDFIQVLCLGAAAFVPTAPACIVQIGVKATPTWIAAKAHTGCVVAESAQNFR